MNKIKQINKIVEEIAAVKKNMKKNDDDKT